MESTGTPSNTQQMINSLGSPNQDPSTLGQTGSMGSGDLPYFGNIPSLGMNTPYASDSSQTNAFTAPNPMLSLGGGTGAAPQSAPVNLSDAIVPTNLPTQQSGSVNLSDPISNQPQQSGSVNLSDPMQAPSGAAPDNVQSMIAALNPQPQAQQPVPTLGAQPDPTPPPQPQAPGVPTFGAAPPAMYQALTQPPAPAFSGASMGG